jgi:predicted transcriptional regulator
MNQPVNPRREHMSTLKMLAAAGLVIVAAAATAQGISAQRSNLENEELKAKVAELQVRLNALEARVEAMNKPRLQKAAP